LDIETLLPCKQFVKGWLQTAHSTTIEWVTELNCYILPSTMDMTNSYSVCVHGACLYVCSGILLDNGC